MKKKIFIKENKNSELKLLAAAIFKSNDHELKSTGAEVEMAVHSEYRTQHIPAPKRIQTE